MAINSPELYDQSAALQTDYLLTAQVETIEELTVLGQPSEPQQDKARELLLRLGQEHGWSGQRINDESVLLSTHFEQPEPAVYHKWLYNYANNSLDYSEDGNRAAAVVEAQKARACLANLARAKGWDQPTLDQEQTKLETFLRDGADTSPQPGRLKKLRNYAGSLALLTVSKLHGSTSAESAQTVADGTDQTTEKRSKKRRRLIAGLGVMTVAVVAGALYGPDIIEHAHQAHEHAASLPSIHPTQPPSRGISPSHAPLPRSETIPPVLRPHIEKLQYHADTIWAHSQRLLGKNASPSQVTDFMHKILKANHLSERQARHLPINYAFDVPNS